MSLSQSPSVTEELLLIYTTQRESVDSFWLKEQNILLLTWHKMCVYEYVNIILQESILLDKFHLISPSY